MMKPEFREVLLQVWREVGRHLEIQESCATITHMLAQHFPLQSLIVRRFDTSHRSLQTVAMAGVDQTAATLTAKSSYSEATWRRLQQWAKSNEILSVQSRERTAIAQWLIPPELADDVLIGPLVASHAAGDVGSAADAASGRVSQRRSRVPREGAKSAAADEQVGGVLILVAQQRHSFSATQLKMLQQLLEPMAAALENDRRLHELASLREAAEADRRTLLTRLGREQLQEAVVGAETGLRRVMERVTLVAASDAPVLILGETGTGKEVVSRAIHARSPRAAAPFIRVNCGAIPPELIDSQLFGHERGSFTGAEDARKGWFERADGGTLFLDEIGELPLPAQVRLLRVLQDGFIERVGGQAPVRVDVRIVAATHRDLAAMVKSGSFREDLWYRINVFPILLPRLSERREDIPSLVRHFAHRAALRFGLAEAQPTAADLSLLMNYQWPGNIRELGAVIDRATILGEGRRLEVAAAMGLGAPMGDAASMPQAASERPEHVDQAGQLERLNRLSVREPSGEAFSNVRSEDSGHARVTLPTLAEATKRHIEQALAISRGRVEGRGGAADLLKINPHTLRARMRKLKVDWLRFRAQ